MSCLYPKWDKKSQAKISPDILSPLLHFKYRQKSKVSTKIGVETGQYLLDRLRQIYTEAMEHESLGCFVQMWLNPTQDSPDGQPLKTPAGVFQALEGAPCSPMHLLHTQVAVVQSLTHVWLFATPRTAACQASPSFTISRSLRKLMFIEYTQLPQTKSHASLSLLFAGPWSVLWNRLLKNLGLSQWLRSACSCRRLRETWVRSLGWEDPLEKEMTTHSSIYAWEIPWTEEPGGLQSMGLQKSDATEHTYTR